MNPRLSLPILAMLAISVLAAKPAKAPSLPPGEMFFTMKGQPFALERMFPGITAAFTFSDEQKTALHEAYGQTVGSGAIRAKGASLKNNPAATDADRDAARAQLEEARAELHKRVEAILTPEQKALIPKIQEAAEQAQREAHEAFSADFAEAKANQAKADDLREKIRVEAEDVFVQKLQKFLTPAQMESVRQAAVQQKEAQEQARNNKLGK